ncbi:MAG: (Fe-S)-binding protein [Mycoplasmatales bacterium]
MEEIINAVVVLGSIGLISGIVLYIGSKIFYIRPDHRIKVIFDMLPHFNCGACGTPGCEAMSEELVEGTITIQKCKPCTKDQAVLIEEKMKELKVGKYQPE